jgi:hypothetical protein
MFFISLKYPVIKRNRRIAGKKGALRLRLLIMSFDITVERSIISKNKTIGLVSCLGNTSFVGWLNRTKNIPETPTRKRKISQVN